MKVVIDHGIAGATRAVARQDAIIIVDTIRASTTYVNAFGKGVNRIVPCSSREDLTNRSEKYPDCVKSGERQCKKIEGYDFGSSPKEMSLSNLDGKTMLSSTTNGSRMVVASHDSPCVVMGSFCNASAVIGYLKKQNLDVTIVCSGRLGEEVIEDNLCAEFLLWGFDNLLVEHAKKFNAQVIIRGLRAVADFEYEFQMAGMNAKLEPNVETIFLMASESLQLTSARFVKEVAYHNGEIKNFVPKNVLKMFKKKRS